MYLFGIVTELVLEEMYSLYIYSLSLSPFQSIKSTLNLNRVNSYDT